MADVRVVDGAFSLLLLSDAWEGYYREKHLRNVLLQDPTATMASYWEAQTFRTMKMVA